MSNADWLILLKVMASVICVARHVKQGLELFSPKPVEEANATVEGTHSLSPASAPKMIEFIRAAAAFADSLAKIVPMLTSLIDAILFATISALATHALPGADQTPYGTGPGRRCPAMTSLRNQDAVLARRDVEEEKPR